MVTETVLRRRLTNAVWSAPELLPGRWFIDTTATSAANPDREPVLNGAVLYAYGFEPDLTAQDHVVVRGSEWAIASTPEVWKRGETARGVVIRLQELVAAAAVTQAQLTDVCTLQRKGARTIDPATGAATDTWNNYRTGIACRIETSGSQPNLVTVGGEDLTRKFLTVSVPMEVDDVQIDDRVLITASADESLVDRLLYVKGIPQGTHMTLRRLEVVEVQ